MLTMDPAQRTDEELAAAARGDGPERDSALGELLTRHGRRLHRYFMMQFRNEELTRDLVQGVFERVIRARERLPLDGGFNPWLWTIARNLARNTRRNQRTAPPTRSLDVPPADGELALHERLPDGIAPSPRRRASEQERGGRLLDAVEALEPDHRDVILLKYFQHLPGAEVARILDISEGTVWSRTHRALARLREMLAPEMNPSGGDVS